MTPREQVPFHVSSGEPQRRLRERAERWEAIARQLGAALELSDPAHMGEKREQWLAALSVYRDVIKEDG